MAAAAPAVATKVAEERLAAEAAARAGAARCAAEVAAARAAASRVAAARYLDGLKTSDVVGQEAMEAQRAARSAAEAVPWPCYQGPSGHRAAAQAKVWNLPAPRAADGVALEAEGKAKTEVMAVAGAGAEQSEAQELHEHQWAQYYRQRSLSAEAEAKAEVEAEAAAAESAAAKVASELGARWEEAAREAEASRAEAAGLREQLQSEQLQTARQVEALEAELVTGRTALATAKELVHVVAEAQQEAKLARGREQAAALKAADMESRLEVAAQEGSAATSLRVRVESMSRMLEQQQQELADGYRREAALRLETAMGGRAVLVLAHALERWRWACALLSAEQQTADGDVAETAALSQKVEALESKLVAGSRALATAKEEAAVAQQEARAAHGRETAATIKMTEIKSRLEVASQEGLAATSLRVRVESMSRMLNEQQQELADGYRLAATIKLGGVAGGCAGLALEHAWAEWRWACAQQRAEAAEAAVTAAEGSASLLLTTMEAVAREAEVAAVQVAAKAEVAAAEAEAVARTEAVAEARAEAEAIAREAHQASTRHPSPTPQNNQPDPYISIAGPTPTRLRWREWRRRRRLR